MAYGDYDGPDKPDKGNEGGSCNRRACQDAPANWFNHGTRKWYCVNCAIDIGCDSFNLREWQAHTPQHPMFETRQAMDTREQNTTVMAVTKDEDAMHAALKENTKERPDFNDVRISIGEGFFICKHKRPPNYEAIRNVFPGAARPGVIFAFDNTIYVPSGNDLPPSLIEHEKIHLFRQQKIGAHMWWNLYLTDANFMYGEEVLAHAAEYKFLMSEAPSRQVRRAALKMVSKRLSGGLYGAGITRLKAEQDILSTIERKIV